MAHHYDRYFGNEEQQQVQKRAAPLWTLLKDQPRFTCYGRGVGLTSGDDYDPDIAMALTGLQGMCSIQQVAPEQIPAIRADLTAFGLTLDSYISWEGAAGALTAARDVLATRQLPEDLTLCVVDTQTPDADLMQLDDLTRRCEMLLPMESFLRGRQRPSRFLFARDRTGRIVGASGAVASNHPDHPYGHRAWWGMLATDTARRGQGIALILGAMALLRMQGDFGYAAFMTGIRPGNTPSEVLCGKLGFAATARQILVALDPAAFSAGRLTK